MTKSRLLNGIIEAMSDAADRMFKEKGYVSPTYLCMDAEGNEYMVPQPELPSENMAVQLIHEFMQYKGIIIYVYVNEAWMIDASKTKKMRKRIKTVHNEYSSLEHHPDRVEVVVFAGEDADGMVMAKRRIIRPKFEVPYLGPLELTPLDRIEDRMVSMLPRGNM